MRALFLSLMLTAPAFAWEQGDAFNLPPHCIVDGIVQTYIPGCVMMGPKRQAVKQEQAKPTEQEIAQAEAKRQERQAKLDAYYKRMDDLQARYNALAGQGRLGAAREISTEMADLEAARISVLLGGDVPAVKEDPPEMRRHVDSVEDGR